MLDEYLQYAADANSLVRETTVSDCAALISSGVVSGGMIPKVQCCMDALSKVSKHFVFWRIIITARMKEFVVELGTIIINIIIT